MPEYSARTGRAGGDNSCTFVTRLDWPGAEVTVYQLFPVRDRLFLSFDHSHRYKELCYIASGSGWLKVDGAGTFPLSAGTLYYVNDGVSHRLGADAGADMEAYNLSFSAVPREEACGTVPERVAADVRGLLERLEGARYLLAPDRFGCGDCLREAFQAAKAPRPGEFIKVSGHISNYLVSAVQALAGAPWTLPLEDLLGDGPQYNTVKIVTYLRRHYTERLTLPAVAQALHYSPRQCQRLLDECLGIGFSEFLMSLRLDHAKELLLGTDLTLEEIAERTGFQSGKVLSRQFKAAEGLAPNRYRRQAGNARPGESRRAALAGRQIVYGDVEEGKDGVNPAAGHRVGEDVKGETRR